MNRRHLHDLLIARGRNAGPSLLLQWWKTRELSRDGLRDLVAHVWVMAEFPVQAIGERAWLAMFKETGFVFRVTSDAEFRPGLDMCKQPTDAITVYRGAQERTKGRGMSWTLDLERARWFARRIALTTRAAVYEATVPPRAVLALFNDRKEQEVVVNPNMLRNRISLLERIEPPHVSHPVFGEISIDYN